eukprot:9412165-Alexandrium_andersonii.AAC.3
MWCGTSAGCTGCRWCGNTRESRGTRAPGQRPRAASTHRLPEVATPPPRLIPIGLRRTPTAGCLRFRAPPLSSLSSAM